MNNFKELKIICKENDYNKLINFSESFYKEDIEHNVSELFFITIKENSKECFDYLFNIFNNNENLKEDIFSYCMMINSGNCFYFFNKVINDINDDIKIRVFEDTVFLNNDIIVEEILKSIDIIENKERLNNSLFSFILNKKDNGIKLLSHYLNEEDIASQILKVKNTLSVNYYNDEIINEINSSIDLATNIRERKILLSELDSEIINSLSKFKRKI